MSVVGHAVLSLLFAGAASSRPAGEAPTPGAGIPEAVASFTAPAGGPLEIAPGLMLQVNEPMEIDAETLVLQVRQALASSLPVLGPGTGVDPAHPAPVAAPAAGSKSRPKP